MILIKESVPTTILIGKIEEQEHYHFLIDFQPFHYQLPTGTDVLSIAQCVYIYFKIDHIYCRQRLRGSAADLFMILNFSCLYFWMGTFL